MITDRGKSAVLSSRAGKLYTRTQIPNSPENTSGFVRNVSCMVAS